jgi:hypothetical protein
MGMEIAWRWLVCAPLLLALWRSAGTALGRNGIDLGVDWASLSSLTVFKPVEAVAGLNQSCALLFPPLLPVAEFFLPVFVVVWAIAAGVGRTLWLRRFEPRLASRMPTVALLAFFKVSKLIAMLALWIGGWVWALRVAVTGPVRRGEEANLVFLAGLVIAETLALFLVWSVTNWVLQLAPLVAMARDVGVRKSVVMAIRAPRELRSKLIETNLVMGVVKIALIVLAMVFSACPLPFSSVETQTFLACWWGGVGVWWLMMSDYFHVVRAAAYLRLWRAYEEKTAS